MPSSSDYEYGHCRLILMKVDNDFSSQQFIYVAGTKGHFQKGTSSNRDMHLELKSLEEGEYLVFAELEWPKSCT